MRHGEGPNPQPEKAKPFPIQGNKPNLLKRRGHSNTGVVSLQSHHWRLPLTTYSPDLLVSLVFLVWLTETLDTTAPTDILSSLSICDAVLFRFSSNSQTTFCSCHLYFLLLPTSIAHGCVLGSLFFILPAALSRVGVRPQDALNDAGT